MRPRNDGIGIFFFHITVINRNAKLCKFFTHGNVAVTADITQTFQFFLEGFVRIINKKTDNVDFLFVPECT